MSKTSFKTISYNSSTKVLTINGVDYTLDSAASGESVSCGSFGEVSLTDAGVLTINGTAINLPLDLPDNLILDVNGNIIKASDGYILTTEVQTPTLISFSLVHVGVPTQLPTITYQAEQGMTWAQWVASAYNTDEWGIEPNRGSIINANLSAMLLQIDDEISTNTISNNGTYTYSALGGGSD